MRILSNHMHGMYVRNRHSMAVSDVWHIHVPRPEGRSSEGEGHVRICHTSLTAMLYVTLVTKILFSGWKKNRNKNWDGGYLYYPFLHSTVHCVHATHNGSQWWNARMGNTDTLHPNSCFCSFSIPTSEIFLNKIFVTSLYSFYAHAHETTPHPVIS